MAGAWQRAMAAAGFLCLLCLGCAKSPDPWSPKTYPGEVEPYKRDPGALGPGWKKYQIEGMEDSSFFYAKDGLDASITTSFTCGKYQDIPLDILAEHLIIALGRKPEMMASGYLSDPRVEVYHIAARGNYKYHKETLYQEEGLVPDLYADMVIDAYVIGEPHCVVDLVYAASPGDYDKGLADFHRHLEALGVPVDKGPEAE